jgi:hypothetical protein
LDGERKLMQLILKTRFLFEAGEYVGQLAQLFCDDTPISIIAGRTELTAVAHQLATINGVGLEIQALDSVTLNPKPAPPSRCEAGETW